MRLPDRKLPLALLAAAAVFVLLPLGCNESNTIAGPSTSMGANLAGTWAGTYQSYGACGAAPASATLEQQGSQVTGIFRAASCDIGGTLRGTVQGNVFMGRVNMTGCTGGAVSGTMSGASLTLTVGDFYKALVTGDQEVMPGGTVTLQR
jgi:hypothetical protein